MRMRLCWGTFNLLALLLSSSALAFPGALSPFRAEPLANAPKNLTAYDKRILVVAFWASWCPVCRRSMPSYIGISGEFIDKGVQFIAISVDEDRSKALRHVQSEKFPVPVYWDTQGLKDSLMLEGVPTLIVYDREGHQVMRFGGHDEKREQKLRKMLTKMTSRR